MTLAEGTRLAHFEIAGQIGAGAMGAVYKARDTRLDRFVAIKVLAADVSASPDARDRFEREARTISQLSHPHICALYDVGREESAGSGQGLEFLVMELLEGETLATRLARGPLPIAQTVLYGVEIADALHAAHRNGIVHRDLKPANVMITRSGVKLLDFGLAKAVSPLFSAPGGDAETAAAVAQISQAGTIAGTLQYMSPEQLEGRSADARSDIFALGAVLYEMASGKKAFAASSPIGVASAILHHQPPPLVTAQPTTPTLLDRIVRGCLAKDPDDRWQTAHDVKLQLASVQEDAAATHDSTQPAAAAATRPWLPWTVAAAAAFVALAAVAALSSRPGVSAGIPSRVVKFPVAPPPDGAFADTVETIGMALSPDGSQLAFVAEDAHGERRVYIRSFASVDTRALVNTDGARTVMWSPDGRSIAFFVGDKLKRLDLPDGAPTTLSTVPDVRVVGTWGRDDILYSAIPGGIFRVPAAGGPPTLERAPDRTSNSIGVSCPAFLPDGRRFLYLDRRPDGSGSVMLARVGQPGRAVLDGTTNAQYVDPGFLIFARDGTLLARRFDPVKEQVSGDSFAIAEPVRYFLSTGVASFATSPSGVLVYQAHSERGRIVWLDRSGKEVGTIGDEAGHSRVRIAPDGRRVQFDRTRASIISPDIWLFDGARGVEQQVTTDRLSETAGVWQGNDAIIFTGGTPPHLMRRNLLTNAEETLLPNGFQTAEDMSPDGKTLVFTQRTPRGDFDIWMMAIDPVGAPAALAVTPYDEWSVRFSPDGRYLAYASNETGRYEVYVAPFPFTGGKVRVSAAGGWLPRWNRNGRELFYISGDLHLVAVPIQTAPSLVLGSAQALFNVKRATEWADAKPNVGWPDFEVSPDGTKFLALEPAPSNREPITAVINFLDEFRRGLTGKAQP